ncbi:hypothetical protein KEM48_012162 [Puccinia striiformis f. sp. tritici PST-130]|nr:hypothetical protein KEM48_012162 [Puccinia striiformis f. sp. tritici PST-130]
MSCSFQSKYLWKVLFYSSDPSPADCRIHPHPLGSLVKFTPSLKRLLLASKLLVSVQQPLELGERTIQRKKKKETDRLPIDPSSRTRSTGLRFDCRAGRLEVRYQPRKKTIEMVILVTPQPSTNSSQTSTTNNSGNQTSHSHSHTNHSKPFLFGSNPTTNSFSFLPATTTTELNRTGSSSHTGRHRRKSSVSISPPFSRTPSPIDPNRIEPNINNIPGVLQTSQIEQDILSRPRSIPSSSLYSNNFKLESILPPSSTSSSNSSVSSSNSSSSASSSSSSSANNNNNNIINPQLHPLSFQSFLTSHPPQDSHLAISDQPTLSRRSSADSLSQSRLQLLNLTRQRSLSPSLSLSSSSSSASSSSSSSYSSLRITSDRDEQNRTVSDDQNHQDDPLGLELEPTHQPLVQIPALITPGSSPLTTHRTRMRSRSITPNQSPWPIDLSSSSSPLPASSSINPELLQDDQTLKQSSASTKKNIPPPLDLTRSIQTPSPPINSTTTITDTTRPGTPLSADFATSCSLSPDPNRPTSPCPAILNDHKPSSPLIKPEEDLAIEDEERKAAEWMDTCSNTRSLDENTPQDDHVRPMFSPLQPLCMIDPEEDEEDDKLSTMEKIFLFANSENAYHRIVVSQRLPELLEEVDISEAVEYVLPLLSGLAQDDEGIREALGPSLCNIMWYYFSKCPLSETDDSVNGDQHRPAIDLSPSADDSDRGIEQPSEERRKRLRISISSFTVPLITLLTDTNRSIGLLSRYGLVAFLCRLMDCPLPEWSEDIKLAAGEPYLPIEYHGPDREEHYEEYVFSGPIRRSIAFELVGLIMQELCQPTKPEPIPLRRERSEASESDEWDNVPLDGDESEQPNRQGFYGIDAPNPSSNLMGRNSPSNTSAASLNLPPVDHFFSRHVSSQYSSESLNPNDSFEFVHRQQVGLVLIEAIAQARCFEANFLHHKLLRQVLDVARDEDCRPLRQQAASTLTTLMISLPSLLSARTMPSSNPDSYVEMDEDTENQLIHSYRSFASDMDPEVRKQICLGLPALLKLVQRRPRAELSLDLIQHSSRDDNREVRIVGYQILGELIYVFHLEKSPVPDQIVQYFLRGFEPQHQSMSDTLGERMSDRVRSFGSSMDFDDPPSLSLGPFDQLNDRNQDQVPHTSSSFGTSAVSVEDTERAMCCSYNFPAVLLTLGVERWQDLRSLFLKLAMDVSYPPRIRRSLARSMHELMKLIRAPDQQSCSTTLHDSTANSTSLATQDWLRVLKFFLFEDIDLGNTESVLDTLEISLSYVDIEAELSFIIGKLTDYFGSPDSDPLRPVSWTIRERVILFLPKFFGNLSDHFVQRESEGCLKTLLFAGLNDPAAAVREAALQFVPILYNPGRNSDNREFQLRLLNSLKSLREESNYRVRMIYPRSILNLVKLQMPIDILESIVLEEHSLLGICQDRVGGVRIGLSRLVHELCTSNDYYGSESGRRIPRLLRKVIEKLSKDPESVVCSFMEDLAQVRNPDDEPLQDTEVNQNINTQRNSSTDRPSSRTGRSWDGISSADDNGIVRMESLDEEEDDDLSGSGIQVDESRLSEDEGVKISINEEADFHSDDDDESTTPLGQRQSLLQTSNDIAADESFDSTDLPLSSVSTTVKNSNDRSSSSSKWTVGFLFACIIRKIIDGRFQNSTSHESDITSHLLKKKVGTVESFSYYTTTTPNLRSSRGKRLNPNGIRHNGFITESTHHSQDNEEDSEESSVTKINGRSTTSGNNSYGTLGSFSIVIYQIKINQVLKGVTVVLVEASLNMNPSLTFSHMSSSDPSPSSTPTSITHRLNSAPVSTTSHAHATVTANHPASSSGDHQLWMRETDGGFVEVGEY